MHQRCINANCFATFDLHQRLVACPHCGDLIEIVVPAPKLSPESLKSLWRERRMSRDPRDLSGVWRFREFLPDSYTPDAVVTLAEGNNALVRGQRTAGWSGTRNLLFKHLGWNPTACFKDLGMTVGMTEAVFIGATTVACASTGNTAASLAAYAARAGLSARIYLPTGKISVNKLAQALDYGAEVVEIEGNFDDALDTLLNSNDPDIYFLNSVNPFRVEGQKTVMFELMDQLDWRAPDYIVVPGGNLGNSSAFGKGLEEMHQAGLLDRVPRLIVVQAEGANPFARMWRSGANELIPMEKPETLATAIRIGRPRSWKKALHAVQFTDGMVIDVTEEEIAEAKTVIGRDGIGCEPASATTLAGIRKLVAAGQMDRDASIVAILTGHVLKDTDYIIRSRQQTVVSAMQITESAGR
jgi:threonine synthase